MALPSLKDEAFNACIALSNDALGRLTTALTDYNKAAKAADAIYKGVGPVPQRMVPDPKAL